VRLPIFRARRGNRPRSILSVIKPLKFFISGPDSSVTRAPVSMTSRSPCPVRFEFGGSPTRRQNNRISLSDRTRVAVVSFDRFLSRARGLVVTSSASSAKLNIFESKACTRFAWMGDPFATTPSQSEITSLRPIPSKGRLPHFGRTCRIKFLRPLPRSVCGAARAPSYTARQGRRRFDLAPHLGPFAYPRLG
jgi:hypothetical protein